jgi:hypothetical protein
MTSTVSVSTMPGVGSPLRLAPCGMAATRRIVADGIDLPGQRVLTKATTVSAPAAAMAPATSSIASTPCT